MWMNLGLVALIPLSAFLLMLWRMSAKARTLAGAWVDASIILGAYVIASTELLSLAGAIGRRGIIGAWIVAAAVSLLLAIRSLIRHGRPANLRFARPTIAGSVICIIMATLAVIAIQSAPNTYDSLTYHLGRVVNWIEHGSLRHYPASIVRQLCLQPFAEYILLHLQLLAQGDRFAAMVQWTALLGCLVVGAELAERLTSVPASRGLFGILLVTIPMVILQGSSTQNDLVGSYMCIAMISLLLRDGPGVNERENDILVALLSGMALLTKGTMYLYLPAIGVWYLVRRRSPMAMARTLAFVTAGVLLLNAGHFARNYRSFGAILGPKDETSLYLNEKHNAGVYGTNLVRNIALHFATPYADVNQDVERIVEWFHKVMNVSTSDPKTTWEGRGFELSRTELNEDLDGAPIHCLLIIPAIWTLLRRKGISPLVLALGAVIVAGNLAFNLQLKFQPWHTRLHTPLFVLLALWYAAVLAQNKREYLWQVGVILVALATPYLIWNKLRPVEGAHNIFHQPREMQYFAHHPERYADFTKVADAIAARSGSHRIGLILGVDSCEYPLRRLIQLHGLSSPSTFQHLAVQNASAKIAANDLASFGGDMVIYLDREDAAPPSLQPVLQLPGLRLYQKIVQP